MNILRRIAIWALTSVFFSSLLLLAYGWMFNETFASREAVKSWVEDSGAYSNFVDEIVAVSQKQASEDGNAVDAKTLAEAANESFTPELLQDSLEHTLDGVYDWLEGTTEDVVFTLDLTEAKDTFISQLIMFAEKRTATLPVCSQSEESLAFDPFSAACKPESLDPALFETKFRRLITEDENFLPNPIIKASDISIDKDGSKQTIGQAASFLPGAYQAARKGAAAALVAVFISGVGIVFIANSKQKGVFKLFRGFAFTSLSLALFTFITSRSTAWLDSVLAIDPSTQGFTERIVKPFIDTASKDLTRWTFRFMIIYAIIAVVTLLVFLLLRKRVSRSKQLEPQFQEQHPHRKV